MARLSESELEASLSTLAGWASANNEISKTYTFENFVNAIAFVNKIADLAEGAGHHPDIDIRYNKVRVGLTTHDQGGITDHDLSLARHIETIA